MTTQIKMLIYSLLFPLAALLLALQDKQELHVLGNPGPAPADPPLSKP